MSPLDSKRPHSRVLSQDLEGQVTKDYKQGRLCGFSTALRAMKGHAFWEVMEPKRPHLPPRGSSGTASILLVSPDLLDAVS